MSCSVRSSLRCSMEASRVSASLSRSRSHARMLLLASLKTRNPRSPAKSGFSSRIFFPARRRRSLVSSAILRLLPISIAKIGRSLPFGPYQLDRAVQEVAR